MQFMPEQSEEFQWYHTEASSRSNTGRSKHSISPPLKEISFSSQLVLFDLTFIILKTVKWQTHTDLIGSIQRNASTRAKRHFYTAFGAVSYNNNHWQEVCIYSNKVGPSLSCLFCKLNKITQTQRQLNRQHYKRATQCCGTTEYNWLYNECVSFRRGDISDGGG